MDEFLKEIKGETIALTMALFLTLKSAIEFVFKILQNHISFKLEQKQTIQKAKTKLTVAHLTNKSKHSYIIEDKLKRSFLTRVNGIHRKIETLQKEGNCKAVRVYSYHNGTSKGFKFYSMKYEEVASYKYAELAITQNKPLSEYYTILERFKTEDVVSIIIESGSKDGLITKQRSEFYKDKEVKEIITFPLIILDSDDLVETAKIMPIEIQGILYYIVGALSIELDEHINEDYDIKSKGLELASKLTQMYIEDKNILG